MILLAAMSFLIFIFSITSVLYFVRTTEVSAWNGRQREAADAAAQSVSRFIDDVEEILSYLAQVSSDEPTTLENILLLNQEILEVVRLHSDGTIITVAFQESAVLANLFTIPISQWFLVAQSGERYYSGIQISSSDRPYLILSVPAADGGVVAARLRMDILWKTVADIHFGETGVAYVINADESIIAHTNLNFVLNGTAIGSRPGFGSLFEAGLYEWAGEYINFEGESVVAVTAPIGETGWLLVTEIAQEEAYTATRTALLTLGGGNLLFTALLLLVARSFLKESILHPIEHLRFGAERISEGDLNYRIRLNQHDEIGLVANTFDRMAENLAQREQQLANQAKSLTLEIAERTQVEANLRLSEARYRAIVEDQTELICRYETDGTLTFVNGAYARYFGKQVNELIGHSFMPLIHEEDHDLVKKQVAELGPTSTTVTTEHRVLINGEIRWMQWIDRLISSETNGRHEYQAVGRDVTDQRKANEEIKRLNANLEQRVIERTQELAQTNQVLEEEIRERKRVEEVLRASQERMKLALRAAKAGAWEWNFLTDDVFWSEEIYLVIGLVPEQDLRSDDNWLQFIHPDDRQFVASQIEKTITQQLDLNIEFRVVWPNGSIRWVNNVSKLTIDPDGTPIGLHGIVIDFTDRKLITDKIRASLQEKEILLKEIHHRVKNNLQIISSLLSLQSNSIEDPITLAQFQDSQNRIRSMALIHERLYRSKDLARIEFGAYLRDLVASLMQTYRTNTQHILLKIYAEEILLDIDKAIPCGLIVNELVSNALKHAFPTGYGGNIEVLLCATGSTSYQLIVVDDGVGLPNQFDYRESTSLGLQLVQSLTRQLGGTIEVPHTSAGTRFVLSFVQSIQNEQGSRQ
jgi:PAS domain S-box-containing protein